jgi:methylenetetrahydrofolate reductase (NADPH)
LFTTDTGFNDGDFKYASELVTYIRKIFGQQFSICVAGYPEMHPQSPSKDYDLFYLKAKVNLSMYLIYIYKVAYIKYFI